MYFLHYLKSYIIDCNLIRLKLGLQFNFVSLAYIFSSREYLSRNKSKVFVLLLKKYKISKSRFLSNSLLNY